MNIKLHHYLTRGIVNIVLGSSPVLIHWCILKNHHEEVFFGDFAPQLFFFSVMLGAISISDSLTLWEKNIAYPDYVGLTLLNVTMFLSSVFIYVMTYFYIDPLATAESFFSKQIVLFFVLLSIIIGFHIFTISVVGKYKSK